MTARRVPTTADWTRAFTVAVVVFAYLAVAWSLLLGAAAGFGGAG